MSPDEWFDVIGRITKSAPVDLDAALFGDTPAATPPAPARMMGRASPVSARLWARDESVSHIGIRVTRLPADIRSLAVRLASAATERRVIPIILSSLSRTGFEAYGFRVERLPEGPPELVSTYEEELRKFWDMPIVIDLSDVEALA
jgi:hypothetical protein